MCNLGLIVKELVTLTLNLDSLNLLALLTNVVTVCHLTACKGLRGLDTGSAVNIVAISILKAIYCRS